MQNRQFLRLVVSSIKGTDRRHFTVETPVFRNKAIQMRKAITGYRVFYALFG